MLRYSPPALRFLLVLLSLNSWLILSQPLTEFWRNESCTDSLF